MQPDWPTVPLEDALQVLIDYRGKSPPKSLRGVPVISAKVVKNGRVLHPIEQMIDPAYYNDWMTRGLPKVGDVVMTTEGPMGEVAQLDQQTARYALGQRIVCMRGKEGILDNTFLRFLLTSPRQQAILHSYATGTTVAGISQKALRSMPIAIPAYSEQLAIGKLLGALDDKIKINQQMNEILEASARALFKDWFVDFGPTRAKREGRAPHLVPDLWSLFPERFDDDGRPENWNAEPLLKHAHLISGGTPATAEPAYWNGPIRWASAKDVSQCGEIFLLDTERSITERGLAESSTRMVPKLSTVVVARGATTGRFCMFGNEIAMNQTCYALSSKGTWPFWLNCVFASLVDSIVHAAHGSVFDTITTRTIETAMAIIPGENILNEFEGIVSPLFMRALANQKESQTLAQTRDLLLPKLLSGEIRVEDVGEVVGESL